MEPSWTHADVSGQGPFSEEIDCLSLTIQIATMAAWIHHQIGQYIHHHRLEQSKGLFLMQSFPPLARFMTHAKS